MVIMRRSSATCLGRTVSNQPLQATANSGLRRSAQVVSLTDGMATWPNAPNEHILSWAEVRAPSRNAKTLFGRSMLAVMNRYDVRVVDEFLFGPVGARFCCARQSPGRSTTEVVEEPGVPKYSLRAGTR